MYICHPQRVFLGGYGWFEGNILHFNTQVPVCHNLFTGKTTNYLAAEDFDGTDLISL